MVLSNGLWQQRYGGDPGVIGQTMQIGGGPSEIVGVIYLLFLLGALAAAFLSPVLLFARQQEFHRGETDAAVIQPVDQMNDDRHGQTEQPQQHHWIQHQLPPAAAPAR